MNLVIDGDDDDDDSWWWWWWFLMIIYLKVRRDSRTKALSAIFSLCDSVINTLFLTFDSLFSFLSVLVFSSFFISLYAVLYISSNHTCLRFRFLDVCARDFFSLSLILLSFIFIPSFFAVKSQSDWRLNDAIQTISFNIRERDRYHKILNLKQTPNNWRRRWRKPS